MKIDTSKLNFNAVPQAINQSMSFLKKAFAEDVPGELSDTPSVEQVKEINTFLGAQRDLRKIEFPNVMEEQGDVQGVMEGIADEVDRLGKITADGAEIEDTSNGINFTVSADA